MHGRLAKTPLALRIPALWLESIRDRSRPRPARRLDREEHLVAPLLIGCARVSTDEQDLTAPRDAPAALGVSAERLDVDHG